MKQSFQIRGMYCPNCEKRITTALKKLEGVKSVRVDYASGHAEIESEKALDREQLQLTLHNMGYELADGSGAVTRSVSLLVMILGLTVILERVGLLTRLVPRQLGESGMSYALFFMTGLLTSVHCVAMCGGIGLSQSLPGRGCRAPLLYNAGRVTSYTLVGALLGLAGRLLGGGGSLIVSPLLQGLVKLLAGALMLLAGINLLGIFPAFRRLRLTLPRLRTGSRLPFLVGLLNGLMPCGPLQAMQLAALGSGSPLSGALSMLFFSLGTVPLMLGLGGLVTLLGQRFAGPVSSVGAVLVAVFGIAMLSQGAALTGMLGRTQLWAILLALSALGLISLLPDRKPLRRGLSLAVAAALILVLTLHGTPARHAGSSVQIQDGVQLVRSTLESGSYPDITVRAGLPVRWTIYAEAESINGCNHTLLIPGLDLSLRFQPGENVLEFTPQTAGTIPYSCWMGMIRGTITVTE